MKIEAPSGRYKIVERDRRLVTIDTVTGKEVGSGTRDNPPHVEVKSRAPELQLNEIAPADVKPGEYMLSRNEQSTSPPKTSSADFLKILFDLTDVDSGGSILETRKWYDKEGPRRFLLSADSLEKLKTNLQAITAFAIVLFVIALVVIGLPALFVGAFLLIKAGPEVVSYGFKAVLPDLQEVE